MLPIRLEGAGSDRCESIITAMVIDMNEAQVRTIEQVRQVLAGTATIEFKPADGDETRHWCTDRFLKGLGNKVAGPIVLK